MKGTVNGSDVVVAIIGGTLLALALSRPRLEWLRAVTKERESWLRWAERMLTYLAFLTAGYAYGSLYSVLHNQLPGRIDALLKGAGGLLAIYALLVHFEPFVEEWRLRGGLLAGVLYGFVAASATMVGIAIEDMLLFSRVSAADVVVLSLALLLIVVGRMLYRYGPGVQTPRGVGQEAEPHLRPADRPDGASSDDEHAQRAPALDDAITSGPP